MRVRVLLSVYNESGKPNLAKIVVAYNQGFSYAKRNLSGKEGITPENLDSQIKGEAKKYLANQLGPNGYVQTA